MNRCDLIAILLDRRNSELNSARLAQSGIGSTAREEQFDYV
jgi:hypothetical protein